MSNINDELYRQQQMNDSIRTSSNTPNFNPNHNYSSIQTDKINFGKWFVRGIAISLGFMLTTSVFAAGTYVIAKNRIENRIEKLRLELENNN